MTRETLKAAVLEALSPAGPPMAISDLVAAIPGSNDSSVRHALRELLAGGRVARGVETRKSRTSSVVPGGGSYSVAVYRPAVPPA